jgi:hypothetical protein
MDRKTQLDELQKDKDGNIITKPVVGWTAGTVADVAILLAVRYADSAAEFETPKTLQVILTPQQGLELAEVLTRRATAILRAESPSRPS